MADSHAFARFSRGLSKIGRLKLQIIKGWLAVCVLSLTGCGEELKTADYLYPSQNTVIQKHLIEDNAYTVNYYSWNDRTLTILNYPVFTGIILSPLGAVTVSIKDTEIVDVSPGGTSRSQIMIDPTKNFPSGSGQKIISTGEKYTINGLELSPCIRTKGSNMESIYCFGVGKVWGEDMSIIGKTMTQEVTSVKRFATPDRKAELADLTLLLNVSAEKTLPVSEQPGYKQWVNEVCRTQVDGHGVKLGFVTSSLACSCLYKADKDSVESILMDPTSSIPLGTGTAAQEFYGKTLDCVRKATGFKGPLS